MRELVLAGALMLAGCADPVPRPPEASEALPFARIGGIGHVETEHPTTELAASAPGRIERVHVRRGERVEEGQLLVSFECAAQGASRHAAEAELAQATASLAEVRGGHTEEEVGEASAQAAAARSEAELAAREAARARALAERGTISVAEVEAAELRAEEASAAARAAEAHHAGLARGSRSEAIEQARARVERARAGLEGAEVASGRCEVRALHAGTVLEVSAREGEFYQPGATGGLVLLADLSALRVRVLLDERTVGQVRLGQRASVYTDAAPDREVPGEITEIAPRVRTEDAEPGLEVWVNVDAAERLLPGQRVTVLLSPDDDAPGDA